MRETINDYRITIKSASIDRTIQMFEYCVHENTSNNIQLTYKLRYVIYVFAQFCIFAVIAECACLRTVGIVMKIIRI